MSKIFGSDAGTPTIVKAGKATLSVGEGMHSMLALGVQIQFQRSVQVIPTIGNSDVLSIGKPTGILTISSLLSKDSDIGNQLKINGDGCDPLTLELKFNDGACSMNGKSVTITGGVASAVSIAAQGERGYVATGVSVTFTAMEMN